MYSEKKHFLPGLHILRGLAAASIVIFHFCCLSPEYSAGLFRESVIQFEAGVTLFFILSCFSLCHSTINKTSKNNWLSGYIFRRFFRIYPLFCLMILVHLVWQFHILSTKHLFGEILLNYSILYQYFPGYHESIVWAGWTIGVEVTFYCLFPILLSLSKKIKFWLILFLLSAGVSYFIPGIVRELNLPASYQKMCFPVNLFIFISGGLVYFLNAKFKVKKAKYLSLTMSFVFLVIWGGIASNKMPVNLHPFMLIIRTLTLSSFVFFFCESGFLYNKLTKLLGDLSYSIYLIHPIMIITIKPYLSPFYKLNLPVEIAFTISSLVVLGVTCGIAYVINKYFETPIYRFGVRRAVKLEN